MNKVLIVGAGFSGMTMAYLFSNFEDSEVTIIDKRPFIGGNAYDEEHETGIIVPRFGAHIFHTYNLDVWRFVKRFSAFNGYVHKVHVLYDDNLEYGWPITAIDIGNIYSEYPSKENVTRILARDSAPWQGRKSENFECAVLAQIGPTLYEMFVKNYTEKFWGKPAAQLQARLAGRVPLRLDNDGRLFKDPYQGLPVAGYNRFFKEMFQQCKHTKFYNDDARHAYGVHEGLYDHHVYTGPIDEFFNLKLGALEYRGMDFVKHVERVSDRSLRRYVQSVGTINIPISVTNLLRIEEPKQYYQQAANGPYSVLVKNYATPIGQYYPVPTKENDEIATTYRSAVRNYRGISFVGRLAQYRYYNMDQAILAAFREFERITGKNPEILLRSKTNESR